MIDPGRRECPNILRMCSTHGLSQEKEKFIVPPKSLKAEKDLGRYGTSAFPTNRDKAQERNIIMGESLTKGNGEKAYPRKKLLRRLTKLQKEHVKGGNVKERGSAQILVRTGEDQKRSKGTLISRNPID